MVIETSVPNVKYQGCTHCCARHTPLVIQCISKQEEVVKLGTLATTSPVELLTKYEDILFNNTNVKEKCLRHFKFIQHIKKN